MGLVLARTRTVRPDVADGVVAVLLTAGAYAQIAVGGHHTPVVFISGLVMTVIVAWRRRATVAVAATAIVAFTVFELVATSSALVELAAVALIFFSLGQRAATSRRELPIAATLFAASLAAAIFTRGQLSVLSEASGWALFAGVPAIIGNALARRASLAARLDSVTRQLRAENEAGAARAAAEERLRIARELHDIVAHRVSVMVIHTAAARRVAGHDPQGARESLGLVEQGGREALIEMRRVIGVLRRDDGASGAPGGHPSLTELDALVAGARSSGLDVTLRVRGQQRALPAELDSVAFRVLQEALTNTLKHAGPVSATVTVTYGADVLDLEIIDSGPAGQPAPGAGGGGFGLTGMRERLGVHGGQLETGHDTAGGFRVHAILPLAAAVNA
jgi:signal transduction histidine kinase